MSLPRLSRRLRVKVVERRRLNGTIDGHDPLIARMKIKGPQGWFPLTVVTINLGRGYTDAQFKANLRRLLRAVGAYEHVIILLQEIDEADPSPEHQWIRRAVVDLVGDEAQFVQWFTREPIIVIGADAKITHSRKKMTMDQGNKIGGPDGTGPVRFITYCRLVIKGVVIGAANQHPHRYSLRNYKAVAKALGQGERITRIVLTALSRTCDLVIDGGDLNTPNYPLLRALGQKIAYHVGLDYIRYIITNRRRT